MAILHGTWSSTGQFLIWGETWRKLTPQTLELGAGSLPHGLALDLAELRAFVRSLPAQPDNAEFSPETWSLTLPTAQSDVRSPRKTKTNPNPPPPPPRFPSAV